MKLSKKSWHYTVNCWAGNKYELKYMNDFCSYFWQTFRSIFQLIFFTTLGLIALTVFIIGWKVSVPVLAVAALLSFLHTKYENYRYQKDAEEYDRMMKDAFSEKPVGFIKASWRKFKDKTCHKIEWV